MPRYDPPVCDMCDEWSGKMAESSEVLAAETILAQRGLTLRVGHFSIGLDWYALAGDGSGETTLFVDGCSNPLAAISELMELVAQDGS